MNEKEIENKIMELTMEWLHFYISPFKWKVKRLRQRLRRIENYIESLKIIIKERKE